ncbi:MAG: alpha-amylase family glycosyl hydrolase, partial [Acidimicrobiales bacterium]
MPAALDPSWWRAGPIYEVYPRSFADASGDGSGDLEGILAHLDHLEWLGIRGLWLSPVSPSPNADWGYDVADYTGVDPDFGDLAALDRLVAEAAARGIAVLLDLVPNHTSDRHPWFLDARRSRHAAHRDFYVWADPGPDGGPPNNWAAQFGGPAWTLHEATGQYYLHNFTAGQPDLNWWNPAVAAAFDDVMRFWWDRGVAGFRIDVCNMVVKDRELRDNPPAGPDDSFLEQMLGQRFVHNQNRPEVHGVVRRWRALADAARPRRVLLGEAYTRTFDVLAGFYGAGDELHMAFNFAFLDAPFEAAALREVVERTEATLPEGAWPVWTGSNLDVSRLATRWAAGDPAKVRCALLMLAGLRGTPVLYQGDEIGLVDGTLTAEDLRDPVGVRYWPHTTGRDPGRTPMPWAEGPGRGFCPPGARPWLPLSTPDGLSVAAQQGDPSSVLHLTRDLLALRARTPDLLEGDYATLPSPEGSWAWRRGEGTVVALNLG